MPSKPLPKPLAPQTLQKKYELLAVLTNGRLDVEKEAGKRLVAMLHDYLAAFSNLYGIILLDTAWEILCEVEPEFRKKLRNKDFFALSDILRREDLPYYLLEMNELFSGETSTKPQDRWLVNKDLVVYGYYRFVHCYMLLEAQGDKPYMMLTKREYRDWMASDGFRNTRMAKELQRFLENLRVSEHSEVCDVDGKPIRGKRLNRITVWTEHEQFWYGYVKRASKRASLAAEYNVVEAEKLMRHIAMDMRGGNSYYSAGKIIECTEERLGKIGVELSDMDRERLAYLIVMLNNQSRLWCTCGWTPEELLRTIEPEPPVDLQDILKM